MSATASTPRSWRIACQISLAWSDLVGRPTRISDSNSIARPAGATGRPACAVARPARAACAAGRPACAVARPARAVFRLARTFVWLAACAAVAAVSATTTAATLRQGTLLVVNRQAEAGSVSFFDLQTETEVARVAIGPGWPHEVAVSPDGCLALTAEYGREVAGERLVVIDVPSARVLGRIDTGPGTKPHDAILLPDNRHAVVTLETLDRIALVDAVGLEVVRTWPIGEGAREGHMLWLNPDASRAYVGARQGQGAVAVVYLREDRPPTVIPTGLGAEAIAGTPNGEVWAINQDENTISVIDPDTLTVTAKFAAGKQPRRLANLPSGRVAVVYGNRDTAGIHIYDSQSREVLQTLDIPGAEPGAGGFGFLAVGDTGFLSTRLDGRILIYDFAEPDLAPRVLAAGHETPDGMAWSPLRLDVFDP